MHHPFRLAVASAGLAAAVAGTLVTAQGAVAGPVTPSAQHVAAAASRTVFLAGGEQVVLAPDGRGPVRGLVTPSSGGGTAAGLMSLSMGGHTYAIPAAALPYVGQGLDLSLFDVAAVASHESGGRLPVQVSYRQQPPALPGVTITRASDGVADGYLTSSSARSFGAALTRQYLADRAHAADGTAGLFSGGVSLGLAGVSEPQPAQRASAQHTLTVTGTDLAGQPDTGDEVTVINVDNNALNDPATAVQHFSGGSATFRLPAGHYCAVATFTDTSGGTPTALRTDILPQFTMPGHATTVHTDERAATSEVTAVTSRPAASDLEAFVLARPAATGVTKKRPAVAWEWTGSSSWAIWVSPTTRRPTVGSLQTVTDDQLLSPSGAAGTPYEYDLVYSSSGTVPPQRHVVRTSRLATVVARDYLDTSASAYMYRSAFLPIQLDTIMWNSDVPLSLPGRRIEYTTGRPDLAWSTVLIQNLVGTTGGLLQDGAQHIYRPGERTTEGLNAYPLHAGAAVDPIGSAYWDQQAVSASRAGNELTLQFSPFTGNDPGDLGTGYGRGFGTGVGALVSGTYEIDDNGTKVAGGDASQALAWQAAVSPEPSVVRFVLTASKRSSVLSDRTRTVWTWRSVPQAARRLPPQWLCASVDLSGPVYKCSVQPLLTLDYAVAGLRLNGSTRPGRQVLGLTVAHLQVARAAKVTGVTVDVSYDNGATWQAAAVSGRAGHYRAVYSAPAGYVTLRVAAADAAGGRISETIWRAYATTS